MWREADCDVGLTPGEQTGRRRRQEGPGEDPANRWGSPEQSLSARGVLRWREGPGSSLQAVLSQELGAACRVPPLVWALARRSRCGRWRLLCPSQQAVCGRDTEQHTVTIHNCHPTRLLPLSMLWG